MLLINKLAILTWMAFFCRW